jgi:hypothetical protein
MVRCVDNQDVALCSLAFFNVVTDPVISQEEVVATPHPMGLDYFYTRVYTFDVPDATSYTITVDSWNFIEYNSLFFEIYFGTDTDLVVLSSIMTSATISLSSGVNGSSSEVKAFVSGYCHLTKVILRIMFDL